MLSGKLVVLATPCHTVPGCDDTNYSSVILVAEDSPATRLEHLRGQECIVNGFESHSGAKALKSLIAPLNLDGQFFSRVVRSGSHVHSIAAIREKKSSATCVDCVTHALLKRYRPAALEGTRELCFTGTAPGIPYVTRADAGSDLRNLLTSTLIDVFRSDELKMATAALFMGGIDILSADAYQMIVEIEKDSVAQRYPVLA